MSVVRDCLLLIAVLSLYSADFIYVTTNGSLNDAWQLNCTIFVRDFKGSIIQGRDYGGSFFQLTSHHKEGRMALKYNSSKKSFSTADVCGCKECNQRTMIIFIDMRQTILSLTCNNRNNRSIRLDTNSKNVDIEDNKPLMPQEWNNRNYTIKIAIGNIFEGNQLPKIKTEELIACLHIFTFNNVRQLFNGSHNNVMRSCPCNNEPCNGGRCQQVTMDKFICDCSSSNLAGRFCNRTLQSYVPGEKNSLERNGNVRDIKMEMRWKQKNNSKYCLMEIIAEHNNFSMSIDGASLMLNSEDISPVDSDGINIIRINISNNFMFIKTKTNESKRELNVDELTRINVGSSISDGECLAFEGDYDVHFDASEMRVFVEGQTIDTMTKKRWNKKELTMVQLNRSGPDLFNDSKINKYHIMFIVSFSVCISCIVIFSISRLFMFIRNKRTKRASSITEPDIERSRDFGIELELYGKVDDNSYYDYIIEDE